MSVPNNYDDPYWSDLASNTEAKLKLPTGLLGAIVSHGERSNNDQISSVGARTPFQITPGTRKLSIKKYGIDPYLSSENAAEVAGLLLKDSLSRNNNDPSLAIAEYHGGTDRSNWGPRTKAYVDRVTSAIPEIPQPQVQEGPSTFDKVSQQPSPSNKLAAVHQAYLSGQMSPDEKAQYEGDIKNGLIMAPKGFSLKENTQTVLPQAVADAYAFGKMSPEEKQQLEQDLSKGLVKLPEGTLKSNEIPGQQRIVDKEVPTTFGDKVQGAGEAALSTATGLTGGTVGMALGAGKGIASALLDGSFGTPQAAAQVEKAAMQGASDFTYQPRGQLGQDYTNTIGEGMNSLIPVMPLTAELGTAAGILKNKVQMARDLASPKAAQLVDSVKQGGGGIADSVKQRFTNSTVPENIPTEGSMGAAAVNPIEQARATVSSSSPELKASVESAIQRGENIAQSALDRHVEADSLPVKVKITKGQATGDIIEISNEQNRKGKDTEYALRFDEQNKALKDNLPAIREQAAPDVYDMDVPEHGDALISAYEAFDKKLNDRIVEKYKALIAANGGDFPLDATAFASRAEALLKKNLKSNYITKGLKADLNDFKSGQPMTFETFEYLRSNLAEEMRSAKSGNERAAAGFVRQALEEMPMPKGAEHLKPLADAARKAAKDRFDIIEADPAYKSVVNGSASPDKFIEKYILNADLNKVKELQKNLSESPIGSQVISSGIMKWLEAKAGIIDSEGNFSQAGYNKALDRIRPKLQVLFKPEQVKQIQTLGNVARWTQEQPRGSFVNNSNTFVAQAANVGKKFAETFGNVSVPGAQLGTAARDALAARANKKAVNESLKVGAGISKKEEVKRKVLEAKNKKPKDGVVTFETSVKIPEKIKQNDFLNPNSNGFPESPKSEEMTLYHGSKGVVEDIKDKGLYGGVFASPSSDSALSHGDNLHTIKVPQEKVLTQHEIEYGDIPHNKITDFLKRNFKKASEEELTELEAAIFEDKGLYKIDIPEDRILDLFGTDDISSADWDGQRLRGKFAKELGYQAVEMKDEHGTSYLVLPGAKITKGRQFGMADKMHNQESWFHGSDVESIGDLDISKFGKGGFTNLNLGTEGKIPAVYLTSSKEHAGAYGENIHQFKIDTDNSLLLNAEKELTSWAKENGYDSAQKMIDEYYDGDIYNAFSADNRFDQLAKEAKEKGKDVAIVDFGKLRGSRDGGNRFSAGKVAIVLNTKKTIKETK